MTFATTFTITNRMTQSINSDRAGSFCLASL